MNKTKMNELTAEELRPLNDFTTFIENEDMEGALKVAKDALDAFPDCKAIWHNQVGALTSIVEADYYAAFAHYRKSLEAGFDRDTCDDNLWEAAEDFMNSLTDENGFNAILFPEDGSSLRANHLVQKYLELMPEGQYRSQAEARQIEFQNATQH